MAGQTMSTAQPLLQVTGLSKEFHVHELGKVIKACGPVDFEVSAGEFVAITGKSGSGKSTILKLIYRTYVPQTGQAFYQSPALGSVDLFQLGAREILWLRRREIGYVSQFLGIIPRTTARQVLHDAVLERGGTREEAAAEAIQMLEYFEIDRALWDSFVNTFSGGEKLRLNIARAMVKKPSLLLLDEPTASLDPQSKAKVAALLTKLKSVRTTMLGIFHDREFMVGLVDREYRMSGGKIDEILTGI